MEILRTDGAGKHHHDERLIKVRDLLKKIPVQPIGLIQDHKGCLMVNWLEQPTEVSKEIVRLIWEEFNEYNIEHYLLTPKSI